MPSNAVPIIQIIGEHSKKKIAIIAAKWNEEICNSLVDNADSTINSYGLESYIYRVAGSFELIAAANEAIKAGFDAVAIFGVIIRGETPHFEYVSQAVTEGAVQLSLKGIPIGFGVLTCDDQDQALARSGIAGSKENKGKDTIDAIMLSFDAFEKINDQTSIRK